MTQLLFLPGMAQDARAFDSVGLAGAQTYVYPGHGGRAVSAMTLGEIADDAVAAVSGRIDLVGVALGGIIAQHIIVRHPHRVRSAVLANTPSGVSDPAALLARADATDTEGPQVDELIARWLRPATVAAAGDAVVYLRDVLERIDIHGLAQVQRSMAGHDTAAELTGDGHPVTVVVGEDDHVGIGATERLGQLFLTHRMRRIAGGHMVHLDNPQGFRRVVMEHLAWVDMLERGAEMPQERERRNAR